MTEEFAALHRDGCFLLPNAWDAGSARILASVGFPAIALRELGVRRVTVGGSLARAMYRHLLDSARELAEHGTSGYAGRQIPQNDLNELFKRRD